MSHMNPFNMSNELKNLSNIVKAIKNKNTNIDCKIEDIDGKIENLEINKTDNSELTNNIDNIKDELKNLRFKIDLIIKNQIVSNYSKIQNRCP